jgi:hypothetical protein
VTLSLAHTLRMRLFRAPLQAPVCSMKSYCCPDAKHCLTPIDPPKACGATAPCATGQTCCPLTKMCVSVGPACVPPTVCPATSYCCPDAKHCLTPVKAGTFCDPSKKTACATGEVCCPVRSASPPV